MARRYSSNLAQRKAVKKARKEHVVPGALETFDPTTLRNADWLGPGPGWFGETQRHSEAAISGHRAAGRGGGKGDRGHAGKPAKVETRAAKRSSQNQEAVLIFLEMVDDI